MLYVVSIRFRGKSSGVDLGEQVMTSTATRETGKIVRTASYASRDDALAAAPSRCEAEVGERTARVLHYECERVGEDRGDC